MYRADSDCQASLEEAAVNRPGRYAGIRNNDVFEHRRRGTAAVRIGIDTTVP